MRTTLESKTPILQSTLSVETDVATKHDDQPAPLDVYESGNAEELISYQNLFGAPVDQGVTTKVFELMLAERSSAKPEIVLNAKESLVSDVWWAELTEQIDALPQMPNSANFNGLDEEIRETLRSLAEQAPHCTIAV